MTNGSPTELTLTEELLLISLDDEKGHGLNDTHLGTGLVGALLTDLVLLESVEERDGAVHVVTTRTLPSDLPLLRRTTEVIEADARPRDVKYWVKKLPGALKPLTSQAAERLVARGVLAEKKTAVLRLDRLPTLDDRPETALVARLREVLLESREPTDHDAALIALLRALKLVDQLGGKEERKELRKAADRLADRGPSAKAVASVIKGVNAGIALVLGAAMLAGASS